MIAAGRGNVVSTASISGVRPAASESPYAASKAAVIALTASAALEYGPMGIRVNCVSPGTIHTGMTDPLLSFTQTDTNWPGSATVGSPRSYRHHRGRTAHARPVGRRTTTSMRAGG